MNSSQTQQESRKQLAEAVAVAWRDIGFHYAIVHGLHHYPERLGRDLDMVARREDVPRAFRTAVDVAAGYGFGDVLFRWSHWGLYQLALINRETCTSLPIDFMCTTDVWRAKWIDLVSQRKFDEMLETGESLGPFRISREGTFIKACIRPLVCGDLSRFGFEFPLPVAYPDRVDEDWLEAVLGDYGRALLASPTVQALRDHYPRAVGQLQKAWTRRNPLAAVASAIAAIKGRVLRKLANASDILVVETSQPDLVRELLKELRPQLQNLFIEISVIAEPEPTTAVGRRKKYAFAWRTVPVSEFQLRVMVRPSAEATRIEIEAGGARWRGEPDWILRLPLMPADQTTATLFNSIIDLLVGKYGIAPPNLKHN